MSLLLCAESNLALFEAPLVKDVPVQYRFKEFNGSFMNEDTYRKVGSPEVDKAWEDLGSDCKYTLSIRPKEIFLTITDRAGVISYEEGLASGLKSSFVQRAEKYGGGFIVNVEGMHHLHCLVTLPSRQTLEIIVFN